MMNSIIETGISHIGSQPWGTHFCQVYKDKQELLDTLVAYFKAGLDGNEFCLWITTEGMLSPEEAREALREVVPDLDTFLDSGRIEIVPHTELYLEDGRLNSQRLVYYCLDKLRTALASGYEGLRIAGDASWVRDMDRKVFSDHEAFINRFVRYHRLIVLCTYHADDCDASSIADLMSTHELTLMESRGRQSVWESPEHLETRQALRRSNERLALLSEAAASLLTADDPESLIQPLGERLMQHLNCDIFFNFLADREHRRLHLNAYSGISEAMAHQIGWLDYGEAVCGNVAKTGKTEVICQIPQSADPRAKLVRAYGAHAYACTPLISNEGVLMGTLSFGTRSREGFEQDQLELMQTLANQIATALKRKQTENALRQSESRFRSLFDYSPDAVFITETNGTVEAANPAASSIFGMTEEQICRVGRAGLIDLDDPRTEIALEERRRTGSFVDIEINYVRSNGEKFPAEVSSVVMPGQTDKAFVIVRDISKRRKAERALRESEERLSRTREFSKVMPLHVSLDGRWLKLPSTFVEFLGYDREEELLGHEFKEVTHPDDFWADWSQVIKLVSGEIKSFEMEKRFIRRDGSITWGYLNCSVVADEEGRSVHLLTYIRDINEQKRVEQEMEDLLLREKRIADTLQQSLVPPSVPSQIGDYRIAAKYRPALKEAEVGGDFYDVFELGRGKIGVLIGDVAGKGLGAAMRVAAARYSIRGYAYLGPRPGRVLELANESLCKDNSDEGGILTAFLAVIDTELGSITYAKAGHEPPMLIDSRGAAIELDGNGMPLGVMLGQSYEERRRRLDAGDRIVMITDGITEARTEGWDLFEKHRVLECLKQTRGYSPEETADRLLDRALEHAGGQLQDDAAIVVVDRTR